MWVSQRVNEKRLTPLIRTNEEEQRGWGVHAATSLKGGGNRTAPPTPPSHLSLSKDKNRATLASAGRTEVSHRSDPQGKGSYLGSGG